MTNESSRILIVLIAGIGDLVLASKSIRSLYNSYPGSVRMSLLTSSEAVPIARNYPWIDQVYPFPIRELRIDKLRLLDIFRLIKALRGTEFDLIINLYRIGSWTGALKMGLLFSLLRAKAKVGHDQYGFGWFLTHKLPADTFRNRHVVDAMQAIASKTGGVSDNRGIEVFWKTGIASKWDDFFTRPAGNFIVGINPGGDRENRRWSPDRFSAVAMQLIERFHARIILLGGPAEKNIASSIEGMIPSDINNLSGEIPLDELPYVISRLDLLITNDSGPMHIAAATKTLLVALFGPEDPKLFGPYTTPELYRVIQKDVLCRPCGEKKCLRPSCLDLITPEEVLEACVELLEGKP
jgi:lipopolysaccharide heptosyltransferase II